MSFIIYIAYKSKNKNKGGTCTQTTHLKPAFGHEEVVFNALFSELVCDVEAHGAVLVVDLSFGVVVEDGVGIIDLFELLCRFGVVGVLVWVILQCQFP